MAEKEKIYVTFTCKKCGKAFLDVDDFDEVVDLPLKTKYCPECISLGFKNAKPKKSTSRKKQFEMLIKQNNITDKSDISILNKEYQKHIKNCEEFGKKISIPSIFKMCLEVLSYYKA